VPRKDDDNSKCDGCPALKACQGAFLDSEQGCHIVRTLWGAVASKRVDGQQI